MPLNLSLAGEKLLHSSLENNSRKRKLLRRKHLGKHCLKLTRKLDCRQRRSGRDLRNNKKMKFKLLKI
jgi:hypothetical protein